VRAHQQYTDQSRHGANDPFIELVVIRKPVQTREGEGRINQGGAVKIRRGILVAAPIQQGPDQVAIHALIGMHGTRAQLRKSKTGRNRRDREEYQRGAAAVFQSLLPSRHAISAK